MTLVSVSYTWFLSLFPRHLGSAITGLKEAKNLAGKNPPSDSITNAEIVYNVGRGTLSSKP